MSLRGKTALVTGAATGIGAAIAKGLAEAGTLVFGADIAWKAEQGARIEHLHCDVTDPASVERCVSDIEARHGAVDILVNNAALAAALTPKPFEKITPEEWVRVVTVNTLSQFLCTKAVVPRMREKNGGESSTLPLARFSSARRTCSTISRAKARSLR
jgi:p-cumic alcohol dehydrogenase